MRAFCFLVPVGALLLGHTAGAPCDILDAANTECVAAHSLVRALYDAYDGPLYTVQRRSDNQTLNITTLVSGGFANITAQDSFCGGTQKPVVASNTTINVHGMPSLSFRHCAAQGFVTTMDVGPTQDHTFTVVPGLNGEAGSISFRSVNYPADYIAPVLGAESGRVGITAAASAAEASWTIAAAPMGGYTILNAEKGLYLAPGTNLTGDCQGEFHDMAKSVYLSSQPAAWGFGSDSCTVLQIFDQSPRGNHLTVGPAGGTVRFPDMPVQADSFPTIVGGHRVYGAYFQGKMGYRNDNTTGIAVADDAETIYAVWSGRIYNPGCCMDYGNAETDNDADGPGTMECVYFGTWNATKSGWCGGTGEGPWIMADLEAGLWACEEPHAINPKVISQKAEFVTGLVKGQPGRWAIKAGNATGGPLLTSFEGPRPPQYEPMKKQGAIVLGIGGDNSNGATGVWFEGVMTQGYTTDTTDNAVHANIVSAYGK